MTIIWRSENKVKTTRGFFLELLYTHRLVHLKCFNHSQYLDNATDKAL